MKLNLTILSTTLKYFVHVDEQMETMDDLRESMILEVVGRENRLFVLSLNPP